MKKIVIMFLLILVLAVPALCNEKIDEATARNLRVCESNIKALANALELYANEHGRDYPTPWEFKSKSFEKYIFKSVGRTLSEPSKIYLCPPWDYLVYERSEKEKGFALFCKEPEKYGLKALGFSTRRGFYRESIPAETAVQEKGTTEKSSVEKVATKKTVETAKTPVEKETSPQLLEKKPVEKKTVEKTEPVKVKQTNPAEKPAIKPTAVGNSDKRDVKITPVTDTEKKAMTALIGELYSAYQNRNLDRIMELEKEAIDRSARKLDQQGKYKYQEVVDAFRETKRDLFQSDDFKMNPLNLVGISFRRNGNVYQAVSLVPIISTGLVNIGTMKVRLRIATITFEKLDGNFKIVKMQLY